MSVAAFVVLLCIGVPIAFVLGITALLFVPVVGTEMLIGFPQRMYVGVNKFVLMAIPFFILAGALMNEGGLTQRMVRFAQCIVGRVQGGLAMTSVFVSMLFAGVSGSSQADAAVFGKTIVPAMVKEGYGLGYSAGLVAASSVVAPIIPPSIIMVLIAVVADLSVGALFIAGVIPGALLGLGLMGMAYLYARIHGYPKGPKPSMRELVKAAGDAALALIMPIIILGGILSGYFTPTEAAAVAVAYSFVVGFFVYGELKLSAIPRIILETSVITCAIMFVFATAYLLSWVIAFADVPMIVAAWLEGAINSQITFLLVANLVLLFVGLWMDPGAALVVLVPILLPIAEMFDVHPIHFALVVAVNLVIGMITPPVGYVLYTLAPVVNVSLAQLSRAVMPFLIVEIVILGAITYLPEIALWMPRLFGYV